MHRTDTALHGNAPDRSSTALLIIDMINDLEFDEGPQLLKYARPAALQIAALAARLRAASIPIIYANDNFGKWQSDFRAQVDHCLYDGVRGEAIVSPLIPQESDYFVLKPKHSAFYGTTLSILLDYLQVERLILTGVATDICVMVTASDAYMRDFELCVPEDCVAANNLEQSKSALGWMERVLKADVRRSPQLPLDRDAR